MLPGTEGLDTTDINVDVVDAGNDRYTVTLQSARAIRAAEMRARPGEKQVWARTIVSAVGVGIAELMNRTGTGPEPEGGPIIAGPETEVLGPNRCRLRVRNAKARETLSKVARSLHTSPERIVKEVVVTSLALIAQEHARAGNGR